MTLDDLNKISIENLSTDSLHAIIEGDNNGEYFDLCPNASEDDSEEIKLMRLMNVAREELLKDSVYSIEFRYRGYGDSFDYCDWDYFFNNVDFSQIRYGQLRTKIGNKWDDFSKFVAEVVERKFSVEGYEINDGGGGDTTWDLDKNTLEHEGFYYETIKKDESEDLLDLNNLTIDKK